MVTVIVKLDAILMALSVNGQQVQVLPTLVLILLLLPQLALVSSELEWNHGAVMYKKINYLYLNNTLHS